MFEGTEKKLELVLEGPMPGWPKRQPHRWDAAVEACGATIVRRMTRPTVDAYLLSESSLFVWERRVLMITCGQTSLVESTGPLLEQVGLENVAFVFYARKNMRDPARQPSSFAEDHRRLACYFQGQTCRLGLDAGNHVDVFCAARETPPQAPDTTLQVCMYDLKPAAENDFAVAAGNCCPAPAVDQIKTLLPGMQLDQHFFEPCGYSLNAVAGSHYSTVHVTPQPGGSYASFETNQPGRDAGTILDILTNVFRPGSFSILVTSRAGKRPSNMPAPSIPAAPPRYRLAHQMRADMEGEFHIAFGSFGAASKAGF